MPNQRTGDPVAREESQLQAGHFARKTNEPKRQNSHGPYGFGDFESTKDRKRVTIVDMFLAILGMHILTLMFFVGLVGSAVVVLISFWEDGKELFGKD